MHAAPAVQTLAVLLILSAMATSPVLSDESWRTPKGDIIVQGMSKAEVLARAGPPDLSEDLNCDNSCDVKVSAFYYFVGRHPNRLAVTLKFRGTRLIDIETVIIR